MKEVEQQVRRGLETFQWLIYQMTSPVFQHLFMNPSERGNILPAITSLLAGDLYGNAAVKEGLRRLRVLYYLFCFRFPLRTSVHWSRRRHALRSGSSPMEARG